MAWTTGAVDYAAIANAIAIIFEDKIAWQINRAVVLGQLLAVKPGRGQNITWDIRTGTAVPTTPQLADGADVTTFNSDTKQPATLYYGNYYDAFAVGGMAIDLAMSSANPAELEDLVGEELVESTTRIAAGIAYDVYNGNGATAPPTIMGLCDSTNGGLLATGTYATVSRSGYPQWASNVISNGGVRRPITFGQMQDMERKIYVASGKLPDLIVADPVTYEKYGQLFQGARRYIEDITLASGKKITADGGWKALEFNGIPIVRDIMCPAGTMLFLSTDEVFLVQPPSLAPGNMGETSATGTPEAQYGGSKMNLRVKVKALAETGDHMKIAQFCRVQAQVRRPQACGQIVDLLTS